MASQTLRRSALSSPPGRNHRPPPSTGARGFETPTIAEVYEAHFRYVWRCLRGLGVRDDQLDDAAQDVFLVVQRKLENFDGNVRLSTWLYGIALRVARRYRARAAKEAVRFRTPSTADNDAPAEAELDRIASDGPSEAAHRELEQGERLELARRALETLDDDKREAFVLAHVEQMSAPEIARLLGLPVNTVYSRIRAARLAFGTALSRLQAAQPRRVQ